MPECKRCGKPLSEDEFYLCKDCEDEELLHSPINEEDEDY